MGSWSVHCGISNIAITAGNECAVLPLKKNRGGDGYLPYVPACLPIFGNYNDYGSIEDITKCENTRLIEEHFGITIDEFVTFFVDGQHTYDREEASEVAEKLKANGRYDEVKDWKFMFIDRQVYDFMSSNLDKHSRGYMDYGTPQMLELLGFTKVKGAKIKNYDPKRFNQLWEKGKVKMYSDGNTLLTTSSRYVYHFGKGDETSIETYFEVPEELHYLKNLNETEAWRLLSPRKQKEQLGAAIGISRYAFDTEGLEEMLAQVAKDKGIEIPPKVPNTLEKKYMADLNTFGDALARLFNVRINLHPMSGQFHPNTLYLTPQCGEHERHQVILNRFAEINKSYIEEYDEDDE